MPLLQPFRFDYLRAKALPQSKPALNRLKIVNKVFAKAIPFSFEKSYVTIIIEVYYE
jgi:hypothetical protein